MTTKQPKRDWTRRQYLLFVRTLCRALQVVIMLIMLLAVISSVSADDTVSRDSYLLLAAGCLVASAAVFLNTPILSGKVSCLYYDLYKPGPNGRPLVRLHASTRTDFSGYDLPPGGKYSLMYTRGIRSKYAKFHSDPCADHPVGSLYEVP